jgi:hypothetical protein
MSIFAPLRIRPSRALWLALVVGCALGSHGAAAAPAPSYLWADADGTVHESIRLSDVPEPYLAIYRARAVVRATGARQPQVGTDLEAQRAAWQSRLEMARQSLMDATLQWAALSRRDAELKLNPVLRLTPAYAERIAANAEPLAAARSRYLAARKALMETLPEAARRAQVPMAWLQ